MRRDVIGLSRQLNKGAVMNPISEKFDRYERTYIAEKLNSWLETDIKRLTNALESYVMTGDPAFIETFNDQLAWLALPDSSLQRELAHIEKRRNK